MGNKKNTRDSRSSKGERRSIDPAAPKALRRERPLVDKMLNLLDAWKKGKNPWISVDGGVEVPSNKRFRRMRMNDVYGNPKRSVFVSSADGE